MRYLAIDPGEKRTGLAVGDDQTGAAGPVGVIETADAQTLLEGIERAIDEHAPDALVVGVPLNMSGDEGPAAKKAEAFALLLGTHTKLPVHLMDERLTSFEADQRMSRTGLTRRQKKSRRDAIAAAAMLEDFLSARRRRAQESPES